MEEQEKLEKLEAFEEKEKEEKKCCKFPTAYTILIVIELLVFLLTYIIPKGKFDTIEYDSEKDKFIIKRLNGTEQVNATENILTFYKIDIPIDNFKKGYIKKPISIPGTYTPLDESNNFFSLFEYPILGLVASADISFFLMVLGGNINILVEMNALSAGMAALSRATKGKEFILLILVYIIIAIGGTTFGMCEEILAFYPILMPIFLKSAFDGMLGAAPLYMASMMGIMFSTVNAFAVVLASYSAGINFIEGIVFRVVGFILGNTLTLLYLFYYYKRISLDEKVSVVYEIKQEIEDKFLKDDKKEKQDIEKQSNDNEENQLLDKDKEKDNKNNKFTLIQKIALIIFICGFVVMVTGVIAFNWWFTQMTAVSFVFGIILMFFLRKGEKKSIEAFVKGAADFCGVSMIVGLANGINQTLNNGKIADTIVNGFSNGIDGLPKIIFVILMLLMFMILGFFIQSSTGLAVLSMPVFAPLADKAGFGRNVIVDAYMFGQRFVGFFSPTGMVLIVLQLVGIKYNQWIKFIWPFLVVLFIFLIILIIIDAIIYSK